MKLVTIDLETYWSKTHSLSKMSPLAYVMHRDTEIICGTIKINAGPTQVYFGEAALRAALDAVDFTDALVLAHNGSGFDHMVLAWRLGVQPSMWGCTLAMARPIHAKTTGLSLEKLVEHYGLGVKDKSVLLSTQGKHLADFSPEELIRMAAYNIADTDQCYGLFHALKKHYGPAELWLLDATIRMLVEPKFELDSDMVARALGAEQTQKAADLRALADLLAEHDPDQEGMFAVDHIEYVRARMASSPKFADFLTSQGVPVPMKPSPTNPGKQVPALAKSDVDFVALQEHDNPLVAAAARTRLSVKSTITETRLTALLAAAGALGGKLPIPLHYCGADTTGRWSGWAYNPQNFPRIKADRPRPSDAMRMGIRAPAGHKIVVADQSGIELRVNHFLWQTKSVALFQANPLADLYRDFAASRYGVTPGEVNIEQRQMGKVAHLGLGFGAAWRTFQRFARVVYGLVIGDEDAMGVVADWRAAYPEIVNGWKTCNQALRAIDASAEMAVDPAGLCVTSGQGIHLPSGRLIRYPDLRFEETDQTWDDGRPKSSWAYGRGRHKAFLSGPKVTENIVQALARDTIAENALDVYRTTKFRPAHTVHDELIYVVPETVADDVLAALQARMRRPPSWWPDLVTWSEGGIADRYGEAK